ncbi:isocitrate/isopropylmalate dehydrogenase [Micromonospora sp. A200]|uniref:hypothetical protein n=1 Tax=Micromonospora sp. A200 TaxID=2940568 RepID=UPI002476CE3E|nr:hypothetical protein [Micromonospora sp. A200]MDH6464677.1 isocitrate/isopropylmalate dehydrogenase [Micromonospora sp. A200]
MTAFPDVAWRSEHIDALAAKFMLKPGSFDVLAAMDSMLHEPGTRTRDLSDTADNREVTAALVERVDG